VADALAAEVRSGRLCEGDRLPTETAQSHDSPLSILAAGRSSA
jgi:hypothetical protein